MIVLATQLPPDDPARSGTYAHGIAGVVLFIFGVFLIVCVTDLICLWQRQPSLGYRVQRWSQTNPWFVAGLLLIFAMLLAHVLANKVQYPKVTPATGAGHASTTSLSVSPYNPLQRSG